MANTNFLQDHYNRYRQDGGEHTEYVLTNDLSDDVAVQLKATYEKAFPEPVSEEQKARQRERIEKEIQAVRSRDDLEWLMSRGYYSQ